jgi:hypothetical protein
MLQPKCGKLHEADEYRQLHQEFEQNAHRNNGLATLRPAAGRILPAKTVLA